MKKVSLILMLLLVKEGYYANHNLHIFYDAKAYDFQKTISRTYNNRRDHIVYPIL